MKLIIINLKVKLLVVVIAALILAGCDGQEDEINNTNSNIGSNDIVTISAVDATYSTNVKSSYFVDLSNQVVSPNGGGFTVTDVQSLSGKDECQVESYTETGFIIDASNSKACDYNYSVISNEECKGNTQAYYDNNVSSAIARVAVSSEPNETELTPISNTTVINTEVATNIKDKLKNTGFLLSDDFRLTSVTLPYGYGGYAVVDSTDDRVIHYTPPTEFTGVDRILYTYQDIQRGLVLMGALDISVGYEENEGFTIEDNIEYPDTVSINTPTDIDISNFVTSNDGDDYQLVYSESFNATAEPKDRLDPSNKIITFEAAQPGYYYVSFSVSDHNGAYDMGLIQINVDSSQQAAQWSNINYLQSSFLGPLTSMDATASGVGYTDTVMDAYYTPAVSMATFDTYHAESYCSTMKAKVPTLEQLQEMTASINTQKGHNWPAQLHYLALDTIANDYKWIDLRDGVTSSGSVDPSETFYVTCVKQGVINILPFSDTEVIANGSDVGTVTAQLYLGTEPLSNAIVTASVSSPNVSLDHDTVTSDVNGIVAFQLTSFKAEMVTLTLEVNGVKEDYQIKFIADEGSAVVTSEVTGTVGINQVTATLSDQDNNRMEGRSLNFDIDKKESSGHLYKPQLIKKTMETDVNGEQGVFVKWNSGTLTTNMTFNVTSSYTNSANVKVSDVSTVTFLGWLCGGVVGDANKLNAGGECVKVDEHDNRLYTGTPSVDFLDAVNFDNDIEKSYVENGSYGPSSIYALFNHSDALHLCDFYNTLGLNGRNNWRLATDGELHSLFEKYGINLYLEKGWSAYWGYVTSTIDPSIPGNYIQRYLSSDIPTTVTPTSTIYASCVSLN